MLQLVKNAWLLLLAYPIQAVFAFVLTWLPLAVFLLDAYLFMQLTPVLLLVYFSLSYGLTLRLVRKPFQRLIDKRQEYETMMQDLFRMYRTETVIAPCDGIVSGVDKNGAFLLSGSGTGFRVRLLTDLVRGNRDLFEAYGVRVEAVTEEGMRLQAIGDEVIWATLKYNGISGMYNLAKCRGLDAGIPRRPFLTNDETVTEKLREDLRQIKAKLQTTELDIFGI